MAALSDDALRALVRSDPDAGWRAFIDQYTPLLIGLIRRAGVTDRDETMEVYVLICERLSERRYERLKAQDGARGSIGGWLAVVARHSTVDWIRSKKGRRRLFRAVENLSPFDRRVFELYYWDERAPSEIAELQRSDLPSVLDALERVQAVLSDRHRAELVSMAFRSKAPVPIDETDAAESVVDPRAARRRCRDRPAQIHRRIDQQRHRARDRRQRDAIAHRLDSRPSSIAARARCGVSHFTDLELRRWRDRGPGDDRERVIDHLASCGECAARYAAEIRNRPLQAEPAGDVESFVAAGRRFGRRRRWIGSLAAAAAVALIAVSIPLMMRRATTPTLHLRGSNIQTFASAKELAWGSGVAAVKYRVEIGSGAQVVRKIETTETRLPITPLPPGTYWWQVSALDAQGRAAVTSLRQTLTIPR